MIRPLRRHEFSQVEVWRKLHFAQLGTGREVLGQRDFDSAFWLCIDRRGEPIAAASFTQDDTKHRFIHDLYGAPGHALAALALAEFLERMADEQGVEIRGETDPENVRYIELVLRRGYELTAVKFRRTPRTAGANQVTDDGGPASDEERVLCFGRADGSQQ